MAESESFNNQVDSRGVFGGRALLSAFLVLLVFGGLASRYFYLQIVEHEKYRTASDRNRIHVKPIPPRRGLVFDRNGTLLADNQAIFNLTLTRERVDDLDAALAAVGEVVHLEPEEIERFRKVLPRHLPFDPVPLKFKLQPDEIARLAVNRYRLPGIDVEAELVRYYPYGELFAHSIGYVSRINEQELEKLDKVNYSDTHLIGKSGIERVYEDQLHGTVGFRNVETNARGRVLRELERTPPVNGSDIVLELDLATQQAAFDALAGERGSVVALDPNGGGVLAIVSTPSFDPNLFVSGISNRDYSALRDSPDRPLLNRSMQGQYPPGSTVKPMYALGGLYYEVSTPEWSVYDPGFYRLNGKGRRYRDWKKWGHGKAVDLYMAVQQSCDVYFYDLANKVGIDRMHNFAIRFGLGNATGVDQTSERNGVMPSSEWKNRAMNQIWYPGETLSVGIGQGYMLATPIQLAVMTAAIANRGHHYRPHLMRSVGDEPFEPVLEDALETTPENWDVIFGAMESVIHSARGTAKVINKDLPYRIAGKTGTAQVIGIAQDETYDAEKIDKRQRDHALFVAFAPVDNPMIAVAVIVENGEHGSSTASPVARKVMDAYLLPRLGLSSTYGKESS